ncbi:MAG: septum formation initiator family protein [Pseudomonadota bacterium]
MMWRYVVLILVLLLNAVFVSALMWGEHGLAGYEHVRAEYDGVNAELQRLQEQRNTLERELYLLKNDNAYIEKMIRKHLKFVKDNEVLYDFSESK